MYWANFLHIYQPPTQKEIWIKRITNESYRKIFEGLLKNGSSKLTLNINGILCELLEKYGGEDVIHNIKKLLKRGGVELTGSAQYHAFLPLLPETEIERQILLNEATLKKYFGASWKKTGFFSPEMAYSKKVAQVAKKMGYQWIIIDELAQPQKLAPNALYAISGLDDFYAFFRERNVSFAILSAQIETMPTILKLLGNRLKKEEYLITAMDGETFGHHRPGLETLLFNLIEEPSFNNVKISELIALFKNRVEVIEPRDSTWAVTKKDLDERQPFSRWRNKDNPIQQKQWQLTELAIHIVRRQLNHPNPKNEKVRKMLDASLHSDQYWWASARPWWSLEMIERGAYELKNVVLESWAADRQEKEKAENLYKEILYTGFDWQRSGIVDELARQENEEIAGRLDEKEKFFVTKEEYEQMIKTLTEQMNLSAKSGEYHRAAMIQDRVRELKEEMANVHETSRRRTENTAIR